MPWVPLEARRWGWSRNASSDATSRSAYSHRSPPLPPSPPSGPPLATWASRRNETAPAPPSPPRTLRCASSTNPDMLVCSSAPLPGPLGPCYRPTGRGLFGRKDVDQAPALAGAELHLAVGEREQGVVAASADLLAGVKV